jgi:TPR repeat protein
MNTQHGIFDPPAEIPLIMRCFEHAVTPSSPENKPHRCGNHTSRAFIMILAAAAVLCQGCNSKAPIVQPTVLTEEEARALSLDQLTTEAGRGLEARTELADRYFFGKGAETNLEKAVELYAAAAQQGDARAQYITGCWIMNGKGLSSLEKNGGRELMRKSAEQGYTQAEYEFGSELLYADDLAGAPASAAEAFRWLHRAADEGHGHAQVDLAVY